MKRNVGKQKFPFFTTSITFIILFNGTIILEEISKEKDDEYYSWQHK